MINVVDKTSYKDSENKICLDSVIKYGGSLAADALVLGGVVLGVKLENIKIPKTKH